MCESYTSRRLPEGGRRPGLPASPPTPA